jgi:hypothetical protein
MPHSTWDNRHWVIIPVTELENVDFSEVCETSSDTVRKSVDETQTFIKWDGDVPATVTALVNKSETYGHEAILAILATEAWTDPEGQM